MKITSDMVDAYIQGTPDTAYHDCLEILSDLANGEYTVDNWKSDLVEAWIDIRRQKIEGEE